MHSPTAVRTIKPKRRDCSFLVPTSAAPGAKFIRVVSVSPTTSPPRLGNCGEAAENCPVFWCRLKENVPQGGGQRRCEEEPVEWQTLELLSAQK